MSQPLSRYNPKETYRWNYLHAPPPPEIEIPDYPGEWRYCGLRVDSPLGIPAGPLLNGQWCLYYAALGFDVLTYKTVRSVARECYPLPNLWPVAVGQMTGEEQFVDSAGDGAASWAVSFGMPSMSPDVWRRDVEWTRNRLPKGKVLCVSVVGTAAEPASLDQLGQDYATCVRWAVDAGADVVEANFSCPNVSTCDGQLFQVPQDAESVAACLRDAVGPVPLVIKIGHITDRFAAEALLTSLAPHVNALAMTNSIASRVRCKSSVLFDHQPRGICGSAIRDASVAQVAMFSQLMQEHACALEIVGVGGVSSARDVQLYVDAGASTVHIATAAMQDPLVGVSIRRQMNQRAVCTPS